ncbi:Endo-1,4-beta-xylanase 2 [Diaporthe australafricana]|uniref:D-xylulose reductase n=1 Tax=Diaporthe australafricana TaxID=127596 RepID=A0ABR3W4F9_9PEZI
MASLPGLAMPLCIAAFALGLPAAHVLTNLSCVLFGAGQVRFENRPAPAIQDPNDILIRISYVGVCGSDVHQWVHGGTEAARITPEAPLVMGHEASGIVHSVGPSVTRLKPGDRVVIEPGYSCRRCRHCKAGRYNICAGMRFAADPPTDGTLACFFRIPHDFAYRIPDALSLQEAVLVEPLSVAVHVARLAGVTAGQTVLVQGSGTIGLLAAATALAFGARAVLIADINEAKLGFARGFIDCFAFVSDPASPPRLEAERLRREAGVEHIDVVLECTGVESSIQTGFYALGPGGTFVQIGMGKPLVNLPLLDTCEKEMVLKVSFRYGPGDFETALGLLETRKLSLKPLISNVVPFEKAAEAWEMTRRGEGIKNIIQGVQD